MSDKPRILFACRANAGRSVTAKVFAEHYAAGAVDVFSAGSEPGEAVHAEVVAVLAELGLPTEHEAPKGFDPEGRYDVVVTMGCGETCPVYLGARYEDWELDDPKGQDKATVRRIVADVDRRVRQLLMDLVSGLRLPPSVLATSARSLGGPQSGTERRGRSLAPEQFGACSGLNLDASESPDEAKVVTRLSTVDRFLPVWIGAAMVAGLVLGRLVPGLNDALDAVKVGQTSLPIALGLLLMMYPVLAKVRYGEIGRITADRRMMATSLTLNWIVGPAVMFVLAWLLLPDQPAYRTGVILVGLARCIAMVLIWNDLASGDREMAAVLVALNAVFQVLTYAALGVFYLNVLPRWLGLPTESLAVSMGAIAATVLVFLGIPLVAGYLTRTLGERLRGRQWYETVLLPKLGPVALYGLLFTVVVLFALQGDTITSEPLEVARIALPLLAYFAVMWFAGFAVARWLQLTYPRAAALSFSAASNDFELAIAVAIGVFGVTSGQALAGVVGPLIEVPVLVGLVYVALWLRRRLTWPGG